MKEIVFRTENKAYRWRPSQKLKNAIAYITLGLMSAGWTAIALSLV